MSALEFKRATDRLPSNCFETVDAPGAGRPVFEDGDMFTVTVPPGSGTGSIFSRPIWSCSRKRA